MLLDKLTSICALSPEAIAVVAEGEGLTYRQLCERAERLAARLVELRIGKGSLVALYMHRTVDVIVGMIGVMKSGAAYTVVEDDGLHPENYNRLLTINAEIVLCEPDQAPALHQRGIRTVMMGECGATDVTAAEFPQLHPDDAAYVLFTSGSTGKPKGVAVSHANVVHYTDGIQSALSVGQPLQYAHVSTLAADLGNTSLLLSLATGGCLHLIGAQMRKDPVELRDYLIANRIDFIKITPTHWNAIFSSLGDGGMAGLRLRYLVLGGEALTVAFARRILESGVVETLSNHYGPTETTVGVTAYPLRSLRDLDSIASECVPIGRPLGNTILCVRDDRGEYALRSSSGELHIGGPSVSLGYRNDEANTANAFLRIDAINADGARFYKTGDYVSIDEEGVVLFLGRVDRQVKVNGYRVELEHIENVLRALPDVDEGAVYYIDALGKKRLVAAVQLHGDASTEAVRQQLEELLPDYMVPKLLVPMAALARNANGKIDMKATQALLLQALHEMSRHQDDGDDADGLVGEVRGMWRQYLHGVAFGDDESFFDAGGDSLDAIQLIAELQLKGHQVSAHAFLNDPTVNGLVRAIEARASQARTAAKRSSIDFTRSFSAAQDFFLRAELEQADHYNQALLLECGKKVDIGLLNKAIMHLLACHPALRTQFGRDQDGRFARVVNETIDDVLEVTFVSRENDEAAVRHRIDTVSEAVQRSLSLAEGRLFKARLFKFDAKPDQLLLVAHHIAIDVISWRILVSEISKLYGDFAEGRVSVLPDSDSTFMDWVAHIDQHRAHLYDNASQWLPGSLARVSADPAATARDNTEGSAKTWWMAFTREETHALTHELANATGVHVHIALLGLFAHFIGQQRSAAELAIDVESHGRTTFGDDIDVSRVVGWHTSTYPLFIPIGSGVDGTIAATTEANQRVTDLGVAYGIKQKNLPLNAPHSTSAGICYNYLGNINFSHDERFALAPSTYPVGRGRGERNHRGHELKLSGRIIDDRLLLDLSFADAGAQQSMADALLAIREELLRMVGLEPRATEASTLLEEGTRTGLISYMPPALAAPRVGRPYTQILLTGATGYVGVHVLRELLARTAAHVHCLVRGRPDADPMARVSDTYRHYFGDTALAELAGRVTAHEGDVTRPSFGLAPDVRERLCADIDAVFHFAADTRLFGREEDFIRNNIFSVEQCIEFCRSQRPKHFHYMSTLAVAGVNPGERPVAFSERSMDVGQEFQNYYEQTKFGAEKLVHQFRSEGGTGYIYRSGNVSGHSVTGKFQRNAKDNRFIQFLAACAKTGQLPRHLGEPVVLSPIDEVAAGIAAIALDPGQDGGTFHVDSEYPLLVEEVFAALARLGVAAFEHCEHDNFAGLFSALCDGRDGGERDPDLSLGFFWATRKPRNIRYDNRLTLDLMGRLNCGFSRLDTAWVDRFVEGLAEAGVFPASGVVVGGRSTESAAKSKQFALG